MASGNDSAAAAAAIAPVSYRDAVMADAPPLNTDSAAAAATDGAAPAAATDGATVPS